MGPLWISPLSPMTKCHLWMPLKASEGGHYRDALEEQKTREIETLSWESFDSVATTLFSL